MATLVTGGRGFVGRALVERLLAAGETVVSYNRDYGVDVREGLTLVQGELFDLPRLLDTIDSHGVTRIVHTAAQSHPGVSIDLRLTTWAANADGTIALFEAARRSKVRRVVNFSSECALGNVDTPWVDESVRPAPTTPYGVTKVAGELLGAVYNDLDDMEIVSLRVTEVYGPGLWMPSLLSDMVNAGLKGDRFTLEEGGEHPFQFIYVQDVVTAAHRALTSASLTQPVYNVSGGERTTVRELAALLRELIPGSDYEIGPGLLPRWEHQGQYDLTAARRDFAYEPDWPLRRGLAATIDWIASERQLT